MTKKLGLDWKNESQFENMGPSWKTESHLKKSHLKSWVTLGKVDHTCTNGSHLFEFVKRGKT